MSIIDNQFLRYKKNIILQYGRQALYNDQIDHICNPLFGSRYRGAHDYRQAIFKEGYQILNTSVSGRHWVAIYISRDKIYIYDSFARNLTRILHKFIKIIPSKYKIIECNQRNDPEQIGYSEVCGHISIAFLQCVKKYGIKKAMTI